MARRTKEEAQQTRCHIMSTALNLFCQQGLAKTNLTDIAKAADLTKAGMLVSVAGGGDTVAALNKAGVADDFSFISTAGGAFLEWMEGKELPGVVALES